MRTTTSALILLGSITGVSANEDQCVRHYWACDGPYEESYKTESIPCENSEPSVINRLKQRFLDMRDKSDPSKPNNRGRNVGVGGVRG